MVQLRRTRLLTHTARYFSRYNKILAHYFDIQTVEEFAFLAMKEEALSFSLITKHSCTDRNAEHPPVSLTRVPKAGASLLIDCPSVEAQYMTETVMWSDVVPQRYLFSLYVQ